MDVRDDAALAAAVAKTAETFGGIDVCINNASAINLSSAEDIPAARFDLMYQINVRGTLLRQPLFALRHIRDSANPHILTLSPPLLMRPDWFGANLPYALSKYGMSMVTLGLAEEFRAAGIACNSLWPRTTVATAAVEFLLGGPEMMRRARKPEIMADAAHAVLCKPARDYTGRFLLDEEVLAEEGVTDLSVYANDPDLAPQLDIFVAE